MYSVVASRRPLRCGRRGGHTQTSTPWRFATCASPLGSDRCPGRRRWQSDRCATLARCLRGGAARRRSLNEVREAASLADYRGTSPRTTAHRRAHTRAHTPERHCQLKPIPTGLRWKGRHSFPSHRRCRRERRLGRRCMRAPPRPRSLTAECCIAHECGPLVRPGRTPQLDELEHLSEEAPRRSQCAA